MKTVYIPKGMEVSHMSLTTEHLVVDGSLTITGELSAKTIGGRGFVEAGIVSADGIRVDDLTAVSVICQRLCAKRAEASQIFASEGVDVSCFLGAERVVTPRLAVALSDIDEVTADEIINLPPKKRSLLRFWLASALRSWWMRFTAPADDGALTQIGAQRSGSDLERRHSEMSELSALAGSEGYGACADDAEYEVKEPAPVVHLSAEKKNNPAA